MSGGNGGTGGFKVGHRTVDCSVIETSNVSVFLLDSGVSVTLEFLIVR